MQPEETREHRVRVLDHVGVIVAQNRAAKVRLRLGVSDVQCNTAHKKNVRTISAFRIVFTMKRPS
jgi:hypothetical protein